MTSELHVILKEVRLQSYITTNFELVSFNNDVVILRWLHSDTELLLECKALPINPISSLSLMKSNRYDVNFIIALKFRNFRTDSLISNNSDLVTLHKSMTILDGKEPCALCFGNFEFDVVL